MEFWQGKKFLCADFGPGDVAPFSLLAAILAAGNGREAFMVRSPLRWGSNYRCSSADRFCGAMETNQEGIPTNCRVTLDFNSNPNSI